MRDWLLALGAAATVLASAPDARASAPGGGTAPRGPVVTITTPLVGVPWRATPLTATVGGKPAAGVRWALDRADAGRARLRGDLVVARGPGAVGVEARTPRGVARALLAFPAPQVARLAGGPVPASAGGRVLAPRATFGAPTGEWLLTDAATFARCWRAVHGPGPSAPKVDFARRSVVALVAHYAGEDAIVTHVTPGRPTTVHVALPQHHDANREPGPAAAGAPMAVFWTVPRIAGPARLLVRVYGVSEPYPLRAWR